MPSPLSRGQSHAAAGPPTASRKAAARQTVPQPAGRAVQPFPVSEYAPLQLHRPLSVFGQTFAVHLASALTLSPDTLLRAAADTSLQMVVRKQAPGFHRLFRKLSYVGKGQHKLSPGLRRLTVRELSLFLPEHEVQRALDDPAYMPGARSPWAMLLRGMRAGNDTGGLLGDTCEWLSAWDEHSYHAQALIAAGERAAAQAYLDDLLGAAQHAWKRLNPLLAMNVMVLLDVTLTSLARLECQARRAKTGTAGEGSSVLDALARGHRPIGQWLREVCHASSCANLSQLAAALLRRGAKHHGGNISHTLLKHWSSSKHVAMPWLAVPAVLRAVRSAKRAETLANRFRVARLLTFLCDLARSATAGDCPAWEAMQEQIKSRYTEVSRLQAQALTPAAPGPGA